MNFTLATILPHTTPAHRQTFCASLLAVQHLNSQTNTIVPNLGSLFPPSAGHTVASLPYDSGSNKADSIKSYRLARAAGAHAIVGAARSACSIPIAMLGGIDAMPQVSSSSSSHTLSNKEDYPFFARTYPSDNAITEVELLRAYPARRQATA